MGYTSWSVTFGEQPSAAKWNILGTNDASFNDGTGIANLTIGATTSVALSYKFSVYRSTAQNIAHNTFAKVQFNAEHFDTGSNYDSSTNYRFTAPIAGFYYFEANVSIFVLADTHLATSLYKNGAEFKRGGEYGSENATANNSTQVSSLVQLAQSDYVEVYTYQDQGSDAGLNTSANLTYFSGFLVSST